MRCLCRSAFSAPGAGDADHLDPNVLQMPLRDRPGERVLEQRRPEHLGVVQRQHTFGTGVRSGTGSRGRVQPPRGWYEPVEPMRTATRTSRYRQRIAENAEGGIDSPGHESLAGRPRFETQTVRFGEDLRRCAGPCHSRLAAAIRTSPSRSTGPQGKSVTLRDGRPRPAWADPGSARPQRQRVRTTGAAGRGSVSIRGLRAFERSVASGSRTSGDRGRARRVHERFTSPGRGLAMAGEYRRCAGARSAKSSPENISHPDDEPIPGDLWELLMYCSQSRPRVGAVVASARSSSPEHGECRDAGRG